MDQVLKQQPVQEGPLTLFSVLLKAGYKSFPMNGTLPAPGVRTPSSPEIRDLEPRSLYKQTSFLL